MKLTSQDFPFWAPPNQNFWLRQCAHYPTLYGRISIRVPLWLSVRGPNFVKIAGQK